MVIGLTAKVLDHAQKINTKGQPYLKIVLSQDAEVIECYSNNLDIPLQIGQVQMLACEMRKYNGNFNSINVKSVVSQK